MMPLNRTKIVLGLLLYPCASLSWASPGGGKGSILDVHPGLSFWTFVTFVVLFFVLKRFAWKPLLFALDERERHIRETLESTEKAQAQAQKNLALSQEEVMRSSEEARQILEKVHRDEAHLRERLVAETEQECLRLRLQAEKQIKDARENAMREIWEHTADIGLAIAQKIVQKSLTLEEHHRIVRESLAEIRERIDSGIEP